MIGYGQQGPVQFPTPGDEDHERRAAEEYAKRRRARRRILWVVLVAVAVVAIATAVNVVLTPPARHGSHGTLTYRFEPSNGHVKVLLTDDRSGQHTTWVTLRNAKGKLVFWGFTQFREGDEPDVGSQTGSAATALPAGTYTYSIYDIAGIHYTIDRKGYEPVNDRFATGTVTVP